MCPPSVAVHHAFYMFEWWAHIEFTSTTFCDINYEGESKGVSNIQVFQRQERNQVGLFCVSMSHAMSCDYSFRFILLYVIFLVCGYFCIILFLQSIKRSELQQLNLSEVTLYPEPLI